MRLNSIHAHVCASSFVKSYNEVPLALKDMEGIGVDNDTIVVSGQALHKTSLVVHALKMIQYPYRNTYIKYLFFITLN
jgi:hypothetical protein